MPEYAYRGNKIPTPWPTERGNSLLKVTFKALRNVSLCPWKIGVATGPFPRAAHRTRRAPLDATGSPRFLPLPGSVQGLGMAAPR